MSGTRSTNTMAEGLRKVHQLVNDLKTFPDADLEWLINLETTIIQKIREPYDQMAGQFSEMGGGGDMGMGGMPDPNFPPMPNMDPGGIPPGTGGGMVNPISANPDELRRLMN